MEKTTPFDNLHSREYRVHENEVRSVAWNFTGKKLASGSEDESVRVWDLELEPHGNGKCIDLRGHKGSVEQLCWSPIDADLVATASLDKTVRLWDDRTGKCVRRVELCGKNINIAFRPDGKQIAVNDTDNELTILEVGEFKPIHKQKFKCEVNEIAWNIRSDILIMTTRKDKKGIVEVLSCPSFQPLDSLMAHTGGCNCIATDPCGSYFAVGSSDSLVSLRDISEMLCVRTFTEMESAVGTISFNESGEYLASGGSDDCFIDISNVQNGRSVHKIPCEPAVKNSVNWNPKSNLLAYAGKENINEGIVRIFGFKSTG